MISPDVWLGRIFVVSCVWLFAFPAAISDTGRPVNARITARNSESHFFFFFSIFFSFSFICLLPQMLFNSAIRRKRYPIGMKSLLIVRTYSGCLKIISANSPLLAFFRSSGFSSICTPRRPPLTIIFSSFCALSSILVTYCFFMPIAVQPPRI